MTTKLHEQLGRFEEPEDSVEFPNYLGVKEPGYDTVPDTVIAQLRNGLVEPFTSGLDGDSAISCHAFIPYEKDPKQGPDETSQTVCKGGVSSELWQLACTLDDAGTMRGNIFVPGRNAGTWAAITGDVLTYGFGRFDPPQPFVWPDGTVDDSLEWIFDEDDVEDEDDPGRLLAVRVPFRRSCQNEVNYIFDKAPTVEQLIRVTAEVVDEQLEQARGSIARLRRLYESGTVPREQFAMEYEMEEEPDEVEIYSEVLENDNGSVTYQEYVDENWTARRIGPIFGINMSIIDAIPGMEKVLINELRAVAQEAYEEELANEPSLAADVPAPDSLNDRELLIHWLTTDEDEDPVYGDPDLIEPRVFTFAVEQAFDGLRAGCGHSIMASIELASADMLPATESERHELLVRSVPDWARFLKVIKGEGE